MTISPTMIQTAVKKRIEETFPGEEVYEDITPAARDFQRPSNLLELEGITLDAQGLGGGAVGLRYRYKITTFSEVDKVHDSHLPVLDLRAMMILGAFGSGYLRVADRAPKVTACAADTSMYDCAEVTVALDLNLDRAEFDPAELLPMMRELTTRFTNEEENT